MLQLKVEGAVDKAAEPPGEIAASGTAVVNGAEASPADQGAHNRSMVTATAPATAEGAEGAEAAAAEAEAAAPGGTSGEGEDREAPTIPVDNAHN